MRHAVGIIKAVYSIDGTNFVFESKEVLLKYLEHKYPNMKLTKPIAAGYAESCKMWTKMSYV